MARGDNAERKVERLSRGLGWFSIGLGLAEVAAPRTIARLIGARDAHTESVVRAFGMREIASGVAILAEPDNPTWMWSRVGGDLLDLSSLGKAMRSGDAERGRVTAATAAVFGVTVLDAICATALGRANGSPGMRRGMIRVEEVATVNRSIEEVYSFWRNFENLPRFMRHLDCVEVIDERRSLWRAVAPAGRTVEWEAEIVQDIPDEWIAWRSVQGDVPNSGSVRFLRAPGARGTEVRVQLQFSPPGGRLGHNIAWLFGESPEQQIHEDLQRFKQLVETGEVSVSDGFGLRRPARPVPRREETLEYAGVSE